MDIYRPKILFLTTNRSASTFWQNSFGHNASIFIENTFRSDFKSSDIEEILRTIDYSPMAFLRFHANGKFEDRRDKGMLFQFAERLVAEANEETKVIVNTRHDTFKLALSEYVRHHKHMYSKRGISKWPPINIDHFRGRYSAVKHFQQNWFEWVNDLLADFSGKRLDISYYQTLTNRNETIWKVRRFARMMREARWHTSGYNRIPNLKELLEKFERSLEELPDPVEELPDPVVEETEE